MVLQAVRKPCMYALKHAKQPALLNRPSIVQRLTVLNSLLNQSSIVQRLTVLNSLLNQSSIVQRLTLLIGAHRAGYCSSTFLRQPLPVSAGLLSASVTQVYLPRTLHPPPSTAKVKDDWKQSSTSSNVWTSCCLVNLQDNFLSF
jgi:hypothetical protein